MFIGRQTTVCHGGRLPKRPYFLGRRPLDPRAHAEAALPRTDEGGCVDAANETLSNRSTPVEHLLERHARHQAAVSEGPDRGSRPSVLETAVRASTTTGLPTHRLLVSRVLTRNLMETRTDRRRAASECESQETTARIGSFSSPRGNRRITCRAARECCSKCGKKIPLAKIRAHRREMHRDERIYARPGRGSSAPSSR